VFLPKELKTD